MNHLLRDLLYYDVSKRKNAALKTGLQEYHLLLSALTETLEAFETGLLEKFDSLVGENACQIRAFRIALLHSTYCTRLELKESIPLVQNAIIDLLDKQIHALMSSGISLKDVFKLYNLDISLNSDELFLLKSYLLSEMKESVSCRSKISLEKKEKCVPSKIQRLGPNVSFAFTSRLASFLRQRLAKASVQFVQQTALNLQDPLLIQKVSDEFIYEHNALHSIPMFWGYKILLHLAKSKNIPLIAHIKFVEKKDDHFIVIQEKHYFFKPDLNNHHTLCYTATDPTEKDLIQAACIIEGISYCPDSLWDERVLTNSITNAILAGAADHRQYPNSDHPFKEDHSEYSYFKEIAENQGFSLKNPSGFFIQHVYASQAKTILKDTEIEAVIATI